MDELNPGLSQSHTHAGPSVELGTLEVGAWVGRFKVEALLGQGGMGAVYRVWDPVLERRLALKAVRFGRVNDPAAQERFRREAMALAQLNHRNVCQVHDWVEWEGNAFIAMEMISGQMLPEASKGLDYRGKLRVLRSIARALEAAHAKGIVHRDLKPSNVMVDPEGQVKVLDFGLARFVGADDVDYSLSPEEAKPNASSPQNEHTSLVPTLMDEATQDALPPLPMPPHTTGGSLTMVGSFMGSPAYASPEQMVGRLAGPPSDLFSFGVLAWELLLGDHPFPGSGRGRMSATAAGKLKSLRGRKLPRPMASLLTSLLAQNPGQRPSATQVVAALDRQMRPLAAGWWVALPATAMLVAGIAYLFYGRSIIADLAKDRPPRLAVMPIRNETGDASLDALVEVGMTELMSTALRDSPSLMVVDGESVTRTFSLFRLDPSRAVDPDKQQQIVRALGAALCFQGTLKSNPVNGALVFTYALVEPSGKVRLSGAVEAPVQKDFAAYFLVDPAVEVVLGKVDPFHSQHLRGTAPPPEVFAQYALGKSLLIKGDFKGSEKPLREAAYKAPVFSLAVSAYASCLRRLGQEQALPVANWAFMAAKAAGDRWAEGVALGVIAFLAKDRGDLEESERLRRSTLALAETNRDVDGESAAYNHLGLIAAERGRDAEAKAFYEQALKLAQQVSNRSYISLAQNNLANLALKRGDLKGAAEMYQGSLAIQQEIGNRWGEGLALNNLGVTALTAQDLGQAEGFLSRALAIRQAVGDKLGQGTCLRNLGILHQMKGDPIRAEAFQRQALQLVKATSVRTIEAECHFCLGEIQRLTGRFRLAKETYQQSLDLLPKGVTPEVRNAALAAQAECDARLPNPRLKEIESRLAAIDAAQVDSPYVQRARAWVHFLSGRLPEALASIDVAKADPRHQAPEIQSELAATRALFLKGGKGPGHP